MRMISTSVSRPASRAVEALLAPVAGITSLTVSPASNAGELDVNLSCARGRDVREAVSSACIAAGVPILMMKNGDVSLEQIFLEVTSDEVGESPEQPAAAADAADGSDDAAGGPDDTPDDADDGEEGQQ